MRSEVNGLQPETRRCLASKDSSPSHRRRLLLRAFVALCDGLARDRSGNVIVRLARDRSGNVIARVAAAIIPLIALVGSSIDLGRGYMAQSRLQSACDAGALPARRQLASYPNFNPATQSAPVVARGGLLFDNNFSDGQYGSINRSFTMVVQSDLSIQPTASIRLPTTMMQIFGITGIKLTTTCAAKLNFNNTDVMLVLDNTGSMADTNPGDPAPKIDELRSVVMAFYNQLEAAKTAGTRIRYGFVPYSTNVNVGYLLHSDWMVDSWNYQSRLPVNLGASYTWNYKPVTYGVSGIKGATGSDPIAGGAINAPIFWDSVANTPATVPIAFTGCIEEHDTTEISDYSNVDFSQARDLDIDTVPMAGDPRTQWRPMFDQINFDRAMNWDGSGAFTAAPTQVTNDFINPTLGGFAACPAQARKLDTIDQATLQAYLNSLSPNGSTYHDIGMIWGGRLLSPTGLFSAENTDMPGGPTNRNLVFLTDGLTNALDLSYGAYGVGPIDQRRWSPSSVLSLNRVVENRFTVACNEVKKRNITVWVIGFGTTLNPVLTSCAGAGHSFSAQNVSQLTAVFSSIAAQLGNLRISK